jgi:hypothetical protein
MSRVVAIGLALALTVASVAADTALAQDWRTVSSRRQLTDESRLHVNVTYGVGHLKIEPAEAGTLYRSSIRFDARYFRPVSTFNGEHLKLGVTGQREGRVKANIREGGRLSLALGPDVPLDLDLEMGAVEADIDLSGLRIASAKISTGASDSRIRFSMPNRERMRHLTIEAGAAAFRAEGLGNANVESLRVEGGVGDMTLDFTGEWRGDTNATIDIGLGAVTLRVPRGVGVQVTKDTFLMGFDSQDLVKRGAVYYSLDWESASHRLIVDINGAFGSIDIQWVDPNEII